MSFLGRKKKKRRNLALLSSFYFAVTSKLHSYTYVPDCSIKSVTAMLLVKSSRPHATFFGPQKFSFLVSGIPRLFQGNLSSWSFGQLGLECYRNPYGIPSNFVQEILLAGDTNRLVAELTFATWDASIRTEGRWIGWCFLEVGEVLVFFSAGSAKVCVCVCVSSCFLQTFVQIYELENDAERHISQAFGWYPPLRFCYTYSL